MKGWLHALYVCRYVAVFATGWFLAHAYALVDLRTSTDQALTYLRDQGKEMDEVTTRMVATSATARSHMMKAQARCNPASDVRGL